MMFSVELWYTMTYLLVLVILIWQPSTVEDENSFLKAGMTVTCDDDDYRILGVVTESTPIFNSVMGRFSPM